MDIKDFLKDYAENVQNWRFVHARRDHQNLTSVSDFIHSETETLQTGETIMFLDPVQRRRDRDGITYSGNFMILTNSDIDKGYEDKYRDYIEPLLEVVNTQLYNRFRCEYDIQNFRSIEVINQFDFNADGLSIAFTVKSF